MERMTTTHMPRQTAGFAAGAVLAFALFSPLGAQQAPAGVCRVTGRATGGATPPPGGAIAGQGGDTVKGVTSTDTDGGVGLTPAPGAPTIRAGLTGFSPTQQPLTIPAEGNCG